MLEKLPLPLDRIVEDLEQMGLSALVHKAKVAYDEAAIGTDVTLTLTIRIEDIYKERDTPTSKYDKAMKVL